MAKIMSVNAGSSSLKFQLIEMPSEEVIASGLVRIYRCKLYGGGRRKHCRDFFLDC